MAYLKSDKSGKNKTILWSKPSSAPTKQLAEVSRFLGRIFRKASTNGNTDPEVYQDMCAQEFGSAFKSNAWHDWFDDEIRMLEIENSSRRATTALASGKRRIWKTTADACNNNLAAARNHLGNLVKQARPNDETESSRKIWEAPADMLVSDLAAVLKYLGELFDKMGHDDYVEAHVYQEKCAKKFNQHFDNDAWDDWFDETIEHLGQEDESGMESLIYPESVISPVWDTPQDAAKIGRAQIRSYLTELIENVGPKDSADPEVYQEKCAKEFNQEFDSHSWDDWFDKEIDRLKSK